MRLMRRQVMAWVYWQGMLLGWLYVVLSDAGSDIWDQFITPCQILPEAQKPLASDPGASDRLTGNWLKNLLKFLRMTLILTQKLFVSVGQIGIQLVLHFIEGGIHQFDLTLCFR